MLLVNDVLRKQNPSLWNAVDYNRYIRWRNMEIVFIMIIPYHYRG